MVRNLIALTAILLCSTALAVETPEQIANREKTACDAKYTVAAMAQNGTFGWQQDVDSARTQSQFWRNTVIANGWGTLPVADEMISVASNFSVLGNDEKGFGDADMLQGGTYRGQAFTDWVQKFWPSASVKYHAAFLHFDEAMDNYCVAWNHYQDAHVRYVEATNMYISFYWVQLMGGM